MTKDNVEYPDRHDLFPLIFMRGLLADAILSCGA